MPVVRLGNKAAFDGPHRIMPGNRVTTIHVLDEDDLPTRMRTLTHQDGLWPRMSPVPAAWVEATDPELEEALAEFFNCPIGEPEGWTTNTPGER